MRDPKERVVIQHRDVLMPQFRPAETLGNVALNFVNVNFSLDRLVYGQ